MNDISTALLRDADKAQEADAAVVAREKSAHAALFVRPATTADNDAIEVSASASVSIRVAVTVTVTVTVSEALPRQQPWFSCSCVAFASPQLLRF